jgi:hypothetical protein
VHYWKLKATRDFEDAVIWPMLPKLISVPSINNSTEWMTDYHRSNTVMGVKATGGLPYACAVLKTTQFIDLVQCLNHELSFGGQSSVVEFGGKGHEYLYIQKRESKFVTVLCFRQMSISY